MASQNKKIKDQLFEDLFEPLLVKDIKNSTQVVGREDASLIGRNSRLSFLGHDAVKILFIKQLKRTQHLKISMIFFDSLVVWVLSKWRIICVKVQ